MEVENFDEETLMLRKSIFICHNKREHHLQQVKMKEMGWDKRNYSFGDDCWTSSFFSSFVPNRCSLHPALKNVDILENIASYLSSQDMLNCRLMCRLWSVEMAFFLYRRKSLIVTEEDCPAAAKLLRKKFEGHPTTLSNLSIFNVPCTSKLFQNLFSYFGWTLTNVSLEDCRFTPEEFGRLILTHSPNIESLHFREGGGKGLRRAGREQLVKPFLKEIKSSNQNQLLLPNLKFLHWDQEEGQTGLKELVEACPNLITLELRDFPVPKPNSFKNLTWNNLTSLFLSPKETFTESHCKALANLKLNVTKLTLFGIDSASCRSIKALSKFLSTLSNSLEVLELWLDYASLLTRIRPAGQNDTFSPFPVSLPKVKRLQTEAEIIGHLNNLATLPALSEIEIVSSTFRSQNWDKLTKRTTIQNHDSLKSFRCGDINKKSLCDVIKAFPMISSLHLYANHVDDKLLKAVIKGLEWLTDLTIRPGPRFSELKLTDSGITGIPADICRKCAKKPKDYLKFDLNSAKTQPGLSDLKRLTKLNFNCLKNSSISDASVILSLSTLPLISCLRLPVCKITDVSLNLMKTTLPMLVVLGVAGCESITDEGVSNLKGRRRDLIIERELLHLDL